MSVQADDEVDQFTRLSGKTRLADSSGALNETINKIFDEAIANSNGVFERCDGPPENRIEARARLYKSIAQAFSENAFQKSIEQKVLDSADFDKRVIPLETSIYAGTDVKLKPTIRIGRTELGTDKLREFFFQGFQNFNTFKLNEDAQSRATEVSEKIEKEGKGSVLSWADHAARLSGYRFWDQVCGVSNKPTTNQKYFEEFSCHENSFVICNGKNWVRNPKQKIKITDFVDDSWDESVNCSQYRKEILDSVLVKMESANKANGTKINNACPVNPSKCKALVKRNVPGLGEVCRSIGNKKAKKDLKFKREAYLNSHPTYLETPSVPKPAEGKR